MRLACVLLGCQALLGGAGCSLLLDSDSLANGSGASPGASGATSQPDACVPGSGETCDGLDRDCKATLDEPSCPAGCDGAVINGHSYMACSEGATFNDAEVLCQAQQMHLVRIDSAAENAVAVQLAQTLGSYVWIGANDLAELGSYAWLDGSVFYADAAPVAGVYQNFGADQPVAGAGRECLQLHDDPSGPWSNAPCGDVKPYVCERF